MTAGRSAWSFPHHDGSALYVPEQAPALGATVPVLLRVPAASDVSQAWLRVIRDGEPGLVEAVVDRRDEHDTWLRADLPMANPVMSYRWLLDGGPNAYQWLNAAGLHGHDQPDAFDFRITTCAPPPRWATGTAYQVFPDRFAKTAERDLPAWAVPAAWDDEVRGTGPLTPRQFFGGDLDGVTAHLDHIASLGVQTLYLTPFFPAASNHRYDASTFDHVDPLLGGDAAFERLARAVHQRGMRLMGDLTTNHVGRTHDWFRAAQADKASVEAGFFFFRRHPDDYSGWWGLRHLPVLDHRSSELRRRLVDGPDSVVARWMRAGLDAWRIDVANMTGRHGDVDVSREVAATIRRTMTEVDPDSFLVAESNHDFGHALLGDGYQATMNYAAFTRPLLQWLAAAGPPQHAPGPPTPRLPGPLVVAAMRELSGVTPWQATAHAMNLIGSHDTSRVASVLVDPALVDVAFGMLAAYPGAPMIYAGDEIGLQAIGPEQARIPMPWAHPERWDTARLALVRTLFRARAASPALLHGGLRWLAVDDDVLVFAREAPGETVVVQAARAEHRPVRLPVSVVGPDLTGLAGASDLRAGSDGFVRLPGDGPSFGMWRTERP